MGSNEASVQMSSGQAIDCLVMNYLPGSNYLSQEELQKEIDLVQRSSQGDQEARSEIFYKYKDLIYRLVYRFVGPVADLEDLLQDIYVELFKSLKNFKQQSKFSTWLYRITLNVCMSYLRKNYAKKYVLIPHDFLDMVVDRSSMDGNWPKQDLRHRLSAALLKIAPKKRAVIMLHDVEGIKLEEIAQIVKKPLGTVKSRLFNARAELREILES